jgi:hypothetical protein
VWFQWLFQPLAVGFRLFCLWMVFWRFSLNARAIVGKKESLLDLRHWLAAADKLSETVLQDFDLVTADLAEINLVDFSHHGS